LEVENYTFFSQRKRPDREIEKNVLNCGFRSYTTYVVMADD